MSAIRPDVKAGPTILKFNPAKVAESKLVESLTGVFFCANAFNESIAIIDKAKFLIIATYNFIKLNQEQFNHFLIKWY